ncbi:MAG: alpha-rhamnosidase, partial [Lewinella sp.]|nr:alpha-rhamnosidase [Lewinella sp.]
ISLEQNLGRPEFARLYTDIADQLTQTIRGKYWDDTRQLFADTPDRATFSQHVNALAILAGLVDEATQKAIGQSLLSDDSLAPASIYFKYYLHLALNEAGFGDQYLDWLDIWRENMASGLTTWGETSQVASTRSDCHAWGASPNIEFFRIILGIESAAPGFRQVRIEPHLGNLATISGTMPHPSGTISVAYERSGTQLQAEITLPQNISGLFIWNNTSYELHGGSNRLAL